MSISSTDKSSLTEILSTAGYKKSQLITETLQGSIWRSLDTKSKDNVVIKITNRQLHDQHAVFVNGQLIPIREDIRKERDILRYLTRKSDIPSSIVLYKGYFKSNLNYFLVMSDGGRSLFHFLEKVHIMIDEGQIDIQHWKQVVKVIFRQMIEAIEYIHDNNVCHYDISIENWIINDIDVRIVKDNKLEFVLDNIQVKLCDFGLAEYFGDKSDFMSTKFCGKTSYKSPQIVNRQEFNAKSNDIWCLGICLFMLSIGGSPWEKASLDTDKRYKMFMIKYGFKPMLKKWNRLKYTNDDLIDLLKSILKSKEIDRFSINDIKKSKYFQSCPN